MCRRHVLEQAKKIVAAAQGIEIRVRAQVLEMAGILEIAFVLQFSQQGHRLGCVALGLALSLGR